MKALIDMSQVYLPINNALTEVGHVHFYLQEIGQGVQHVANRVEDLPHFVNEVNIARRELLLVQCQSPSQHTTVCSSYFPC